jgi:hypothetical protein
MAKRMSRNHVEASASSVIAAANGETIAVTNLKKIKTTLQGGLFSKIHVAKESNEFPHRRSAAVTGREAASDDEFMILLDRNEWGRRVCLECECLFLMASLGQRQRRPW